MSYLKTSNFGTSQNSQENTCARVSFLMKRPATLLKKRLWHRSFPVNFEKFLRTPFLKNSSGRLFPLGIKKWAKKHYLSYEVFLIWNRNRYLGSYFTFHSNYDVNIFWYLIVTFSQRLRGNSLINKCKSATCDAKYNNRCSNMTEIPNFFCLLFLRLLHYDHCSCLFFQILVVGIHSTSDLHSKMQR